MTTVLPQSKRDQILENTNVVYCLYVKCVKFVIRSEDEDYIQYLKKIFEQDTFCGLKCEPAPEPEASSHFHSVFIKKTHCSSDLKPILNSKYFEHQHRVAFQKPILSIHQTYRTKTKTNCSGCS